MIPKIRDIRVIETCPAGINLLAVKVETTEPGLYGLGCATFSYRTAAIKTVVETYLKPMLVGQEVDRISELWQLMHQNPYWRSGPIGNNAISGVDMALWDIKGKMANMPLYNLFGGKVREGVPVFWDARGKDWAEMTADLDRKLAGGCRAFRVRYGDSLGAMEYGYIPKTAAKGAPVGSYFDSRRYMNETLKMFEDLRLKYGDTIELLHDVHERLHPTEAREFCKESDQYHLYFLEDVVSIENIDWLQDIRAHCTTPLAHGELDVNCHEWRRPIIDRSIDYTRPHVSDIGGITPALKLAHFAEQFEVRLCWHMPSDLTPIGVACNIHLDLASPNCGIQEWTGNYIVEELKQSGNGNFDAVCEVFSGFPEYEGGYVYVSDRPGHGVDINEDAARKYPCEHGVTLWTQTRRLDGSLLTP